MVSIYNKKAANFARGVDNGASGSVQYKKTTVGERSGQVDIIRKEGRQAGGVNAACRVTSGREKEFPRRGIPYTSRGGHGMRREILKGEIL